MESFLTEYLGEAGPFLGTLALLVFVIGYMLMGRLADQERTGRRFYWAEWPLPESGDSDQDETRRAGRAA